MLQISTVRNLKALIILIVPLYFREIPDNLFRDQKKQPLPAAMR